MTRALVLENLTHRSLPIPGPEDVTISTFFDSTLVTTTTSAGNRIIVAFLSSALMG